MTDKMIGFIVDNVQLGADILKTTCGSLSLVNFSCFIISRLQFRQFSTNLRFFFFIKETLAPAAQQNFMVKYVHKKYVFHAVLNT